MSANETKSSLAAKMLSSASSIMVHLDPRHPEVFVPPHLRNQPQLVLQFGYNLHIPIPNLKIDNKCIEGTLSFARKPSLCVVPWEAVFALMDCDSGLGEVYEDDIPKEIKEQIECERASLYQAHKKRSVPPGDSRVEKKKKAVVGDDRLSVPKLPPITDRWGSELSDEPKTMTVRKLPPYLKVIK